MKPNQLNTEKFIQRAIDVHNDKYDYSDVKYNNFHTKVKIKCKKHNFIFLQTPGQHLSGRGCKKCKFEKLLQISKYTTEQFIEKARAIHGNRYDYSKVNYTDTYTPIVIVCPIHGEFEQLPNYHIQQKGCVKCSQEELSLKFRSNKDEFIKKANIIHNNRYNYSKVIYKNCKTKVCIICPVHGEFYQIPNSHLYNSGCPTCKASKGELALESIFKKYNIEYKHQYRISEVINELYYDFYLPDYNLLIEFHGIQHYEYQPFFHRTDYDFDSQKRRDEIIKHNAFIYKYNYLEFNYKQLKHMIKEHFEEMVINKLNEIRSLNA